MLFEFLLNGFGLELDVFEKRFEHRLELVSCQVDGAGYEEGVFLTGRNVVLQVHWKVGSV